MGKAKKGAARPRKRKAREPASVGLAAAEVTKGPPPREIGGLVRDIEGDGGAVIASYREPLGAGWLVLVALRIDQVSPTPFQRDLSEAHLKRLADVIGKTGRYLDPVVAVRVGDGCYHVPNGHHRLAAMRDLGARSIIALVVPEEEIAYRILALNVEKAHNLREKSLEVIRLARALAGVDRRPEAGFALEFEEPAFLTLGIAYEKKGRFGGGAYHPLLKRVDAFLDDPLAKALAVRVGRGEALLGLDEKVAGIVDALKAKGLQSPYLRSFVVARINPLRFKRGATMPFDEAIKKMRSAAEKFDPSKIRPQDLAASAGPPAED